MDFWSEFEDYVGCELPTGIIYILKECGYDNQISLDNFTAAKIQEIEAYLQLNQHLFENYEICKSLKFKKGNEFTFVPGHRSFLLNLKDYVDRFNHFKTNTKDFSKSDNVQDLEIPFLLKILIKTAEQNLEKNPKQYRYCEIIRYFAIYLYILCGKAGYETLCVNLPLPQISTIRKFY